MKNIYIVNTHSHLLRISLGETWLKQFPNIVYFNDFKSFIEFALTHPEAGKDSVAIMDCLATMPHLNETDYAAILSEMKINIPAGSVAKRNLSHKKPDILDFQHAMPPTQIN